MVTGDSYENIMKELGHPALDGINIQEAIHLLWNRTFFPVHLVSREGYELMDLPLESNAYVYSAAALNIVLTRWTSIQIFQTKESGRIGLHAIVSKRGVQYNPGTQEIQGPVIEGLLIP